MPHDAGLPDPQSHLPPPHQGDPRPVAGRINAAPGAAPPLPAPSPPPGLSAAPDVMSLLAALRCRWVSAVLLGGTLAAVAGAAVWFLLAPKATAFVQLQVSYVEKPILSTGVATAGDFKTYLQTTANEIASRRVV